MYSNGNFTTDYQQIKGLLTKKKIQYPNRFSIVNFPIHVNPLVLCQSDIPQCNIHGI